MKHFSTDIGHCLLKGVHSAVFVDQEYSMSFPFLAVQHLTWKWSWRAFFCFLSSQIVVVSLETLCLFWLSLQFVRAFFCFPSSRTIGTSSEILFVVFWLLPWFSWAFFLISLLFSKASMVLFDLKCSCSSFSFLLNFIYNLRELLYFVSFFLLIIILNSFGFFFFFTLFTCEHFLGHSLPFY